MKSDVQFFRIVASSFVGGVFLTLCLVGCGKSDVVSSSEDEPNIDTYSGAYPFTFRQLIRV